MYPIFLQLKEKKCVVVGAGAVAQRRIMALVEQGAKATVIAPEPCPETLCSDRICYVQKRYTPELLYGSTLVFAATNDSALNAQIVRDAQAQNLLVSSVTESEDAESDFCVPAQVKAGRIVASVTTSGTAPGLAAAICREMQEALTEYEELRQLQESLRIQWKQNVPDAKKRYAAMRDLSAPELLEVYRKQGAEAYLTHAQKQEDIPRITPKAAILVVSFGTSYADTREKTIGAVERAIQAAFPRAEVFRAFTSGMIVRKMRRDGITIDTVSEALRRLQRLGFTQVYCQPTHIINGEEYDALCADAAAFSGAFSVLRIGKPLLSATADFLAWIDAMQSTFMDVTDAAYVLMGHGTAHTANMAYPALAYWLRQKGYENVFIGTVEGEPTLEMVIEQLRKTPYRKVVLLPLMLVAGDHAQNDMAGDDPDSWRSILTRQGYQVQVKQMGLGENPAVQALYIQHLREIWM